MKKEIIISIIVVILVIALDTITTKNTEKVMNEVTSYLSLVREEIQSGSEEESKKNIKKTMEIWSKEKDKLSMYIEHDELEKVEMYMTNVNTDLEIKEYNMAMEALDTCTFIIEHIKDKYDLSIKNIF